MNLHRKNLFIFVAVFGLGAGFGLLVSHVKTKTQASTPNFQTLREQNVSYKFIQPLLASADATEPQSGAYTPLRKQLESYINGKVADGSLQTGSVYFRDLSRGRWIGVNENETYEPASLLKVAIMIAYFRSAETGAIDLQKKVTYQPVQMAQFDTPSLLVPGQTYTLEQLIERVIVDSDNGAKDMLLANIDSGLLDSVYINLGMENPDNVNTDYKISTKNYALFLRVLYNSTYLSRQYSEKALDLLSQANFKDGLVAGVPAGTAVSHKFGEKVAGDSQGNVTSVEFHDCGIVYAPTESYILCVMTKGPDKDKLIKTIQEVSSQVYQQIAKLPKDS